MVTGASKGIGADIVRMYASEGAKIAWQRYRISRSEGLWLDKRPLPAKPSSAEELLAQLVPAG